MCRKSQPSNIVYVDSLVDITHNVIYTSNGGSTVKKEIKRRRDDKQRRYSLQFTIQFIAITIVLSAAAAYFAGCIARVIILLQFDAMLLFRNDIAPATYSAGSGYARARTISPQLPAPTIIPGKDVPFTTYASKTFQVEGSASSHTLHLDRRSALVESSTSTPILSGENNFSFIDEEVVDSHVGHNDDSSGLHLPAGQHLLVDIKDVDSTFLNSEERLAFALVELINESKLTLLSYHCHSLVPNGVSCAGVLLESHVAFHTWPSEGVITMDLFTCGGNPLIPVLPSIQKLFGIPHSLAAGETEHEIPEPTMIWSHKLRGFRQGFAPGYSDEHNPLSNDLGRVLGKLDFDMKNKVVSSKTAFQTVDVYELMDPRSKNIGSYQKALSSDGEVGQPEHFGPDRMLFLDGVLQSTLYGDAPYHESIVHPAMITHPNPKRVAIIGGGEGATLREVLKHSTVEEAVMIEIDESVVNLSKEHLPQWQDCSSISHHEVTAEWCFDDARASVRFEDAIAYFKSNFGQTQSHENPFDVIIMDALDPNYNVDFVVELYTSDEYIQSLYNGLTSDGILVAQVGMAPSVKSPADEAGPFANRALMKKKLTKAGFKSIQLYDEAHSGFGDPWSTLLAFKDLKTSENWYRNAAEIQLQLQKRILPSKTGGSPLRYFDGATMNSYQFPSSAFGTIFRRQEDSPAECNNESSRGGNTVLIESNKSAYVPVSERRFGDNNFFSSDEFLLGAIDGRKVSI